MEYDRAARKRLGRAVRAARTSAGYANRGDFADKMKRSTRQVQALENGEDGVGPDTWAAAAEALGWGVDDVYAILEDRQGDTATAPAAARDLSDEELLAEIARRFSLTFEQRRAAERIDTARTDVVMQHPDGRWVAIELKTDANERTLRESIHQLRDQQARFFGYRPPVISIDEPIPGDGFVDERMTLEEFNRQAEEYLAHHADEMRTAARTTGRAPSGQQSDEQRAAEMGVEVVRAAQERARRGQGGAEDESSGEGVTGA